MVSIIRELSSVSEAALDSAKVSSLIDSVFDEARGAHSKALSSTEC